MLKYKVVLTDQSFANTKIHRDYLNEIDAKLVECKDEKDVRDNVVDADAVIVTYFELTPELIRSMKKAKIISRQGIGINNISVEIATENGIYVTNVPSYCIDEVSNHALGLLLCCARKIPQLNNEVKSKKWIFSKQIPIFRLKGQVLGLLAFGKIAQRVATKAQTFGLDVIAFDPFVKEDEMKEFGVRKVEFDQILNLSDFISIHSPLTDKTQHMLGEREFKKMKRSAYLINTARGAIINEEDLITAIKEGYIAGAGLDVLQSETFDPNNQLLQFENVILTPHVAFYSEGSLRELQETAVNEVIRVLKGKKPLSCLNYDEVMKKL